MMLWALWVQLAVAQDAQAVLDVVVKDVVSECSAHPTTGTWTYRVGLSAEARLTSVEIAPPSESWSAVQACAVARIASRLGGVDAARDTAETVQGEVAFPAGLIGVRVQHEGPFAARQAPSADDITGEVLVLDADGLYDLGAVDTVVSQGLPDLRTCWADAAPGLRAVVKLDVAADGSVAAVRAVSGALSAKATACVGEVLQGMRLPAATGGRALTVAFTVLKPQQRLALGAPLIMGSLDRAVLDRGLTARLGDMAACVPGEASGRVQVKFRVSDTGAVVSTEVKQSDLDAEASACVAGVFMTVVFPPPAGGGIVIASYPVVFGVE